MPALPLHEAGKYVAGAYVVVFALVLVYVAIMAIRLSRMERELGELLARAEGRPEARGASGPDSERTPREGSVGDSDALDIARPESTPV